MCKFCDSAFQPKERERRFNQICQIWQCKGIWLKVKLKFNAQFFQKKKKNQAFFN